jgi:hypothetical protein
MGAMGGWDQMRARLVGDKEGRAMIVTFSTCADSIRTYGPDGLAEGLDDLPEVRQPANPLPSIHRVLFSASGTFLVLFQGRNVVPHRETTGTEDEHQPSARCYVEFKETPRLPDRRFRRRRGANRRY